MAVRFAAEELVRFTAAVTAAAGSSLEEAELVAQNLVGADLRGIHSHGVIRLGVYVRAVQMGGIVPDADMRWVRSFGSVAILDAGSGYGQTAVAKALDRAETLSDRFGQATIAIHNTTHYGAGAFWATLAAERGLVSLLVTSTGPSVAPYGSSESLFGTNPITLGTPAPDGAPIIADMATSVVAYGKIMAHQADGLPIPADWALDAEGQPTTDPDVALRGALRPFGAHKGSGLSFFVEVLSGAFTDSRFSYEVLDMNKDPSSRLQVGHTLMTWKPEVFRGDDRYLQRVGELAATVRSAKPAPGFDRVRSPGQVEIERMEELLRQGIVLPAQVPSSLEALAAEFGVRPPSPL